MNKWQKIFLVPLGAVVVAYCIALTFIIVSNAMAR
jgi:hypothetical protein